MMKILLIFLYAKMHRELNMKNFNRAIRIKENEDNIQNFPLRLIE